MHGVGSRSSLRRAERVHVIAAKVARVRARTVWSPPILGVFNPCDFLPGESALVEHYPDGESVGVAIRGSSGYLSGCFINSRWSYDACMYCKLIKTGVSSVLASARLTASMTVDLAGPRCLNECEYYKRLPGLGQTSIGGGLQDVSPALVLLKKLVLRVEANGLAREGLDQATGYLRFP